MHHTFNTRPLRIFAIPLALTLLLLVTPPFQIEARTTLAAQGTANRERLLNGLSFFIIPQPSTSEVSLLLRIHSGAAFDLAGKEGTMALLARSLFPDEDTRTYVEEELGGGMSITIDYDAINLRLSGRAGSLETLVELLRNALVPNTTVDVATLNAIRARYLTELETERRATNPSASSSSTLASLADRAAAQRLYSGYPLGRSATGTPESLARIERGDIVFARSRFLTPDNATLVIVGDVDPRRVRLIMRQYLGAWRKGDTRAQATFRRPSGAKPELLLIPVSTTEQVEFRMAARAPARADRDYTAASLLASVLRGRLQKANAVPSSARRFDVRYDAFKLAGALTISATTQSADAAATLAVLRTALSSIASTNPPTSAEIEQARSALLSATASSTDAAGTIATAYLDADTYSAKAGDFAGGLRAVTAAEVQRLAAKLNAPGATAFVAAGDKERLEAELAKNGVMIEVLGTGTTAGATPVPVRVPGRSNEVPVSPLVPTPATPAAKRP